MKILSKHTGDIWFQNHKTGQVECLKPAGMTEIDGVELKGEKDKEGNYIKYPTLNCFPIEILEDKPAKSVEPAKKPEEEKKAEKK